MTLSKSKSWGIFFLIAITSLAWSWVTHRFEPSIEIDSSSYTAFDWSTLQGVLSNQRTIGYPLFCAVANQISRGPHTIPFLHWLALVVAAFVVLEGMAMSGYRRSTAIWASGTLMFGRGFFDLGSLVTADSLACSLAIASAGCFLGCCGERRSWPFWGGLMALTFATYQTRPAYLFLIPLWPLLGFLVDRLIVHRASAWWASFKHSLKLVAITLIPFVAFSTFRWGVVGHWGLVSFGGYNIIGVVGQFLDQSSVDAMPEDLRPVAQAIFDRSSQLKDSEPPHSFLAMERMYNRTIWEVTVPVVKELHGDNPLVINRVLSKLSGELMRQHVGLYLRWLAWNGVHAVKQVVQLTISDTGTRLLAVILLMAHAFSLLRGPSDQSQPRSLIEISNETTIGGSWPSQTFRELHLLFWVAVAFAAAKGLLVILVEPANDRYMSGAMPLLPAAIAVFVARYFDPKTDSIRQS